MNSAHLHLVTNHAPLFGVLIGLVLLVSAVVSRSRDLRTAAYAAFILSAVAAGIAYATGDEAADIVKALPGISERSIEQHEDVAKIALGFLCATGVVSVQRFVIIALLIGGSIGLIVTGYAAGLGGQIHHSEITSATR